jgi:hypothetical protein
MMALITLAEGTAFNPPGWVGGLGALVALVLPVVLYLWMKNQS